MNHASLNPWCVPVFPAIGLSSSTALVPVPYWAATSNVFLTAAAAPGSGIEILLETICWYKTSPFESSILSIKYVGASTPFVAKEEYADAISIGVTAPAPKVKDITGSISDTIPILFAVFANFCPPISEAI